MSDNVVHLTGVLRLVCDCPFDSGVFDTCLYAAHLNVSGKVFCNVEDSVTWCLLADDAAPADARAITSYAVTVVSDMNNIPMSEVNARWKKFLAEVRGLMPLREMYVRAIDIRGGEYERA